MKYASSEFIKVCEAINPDAYAAGTTNGEIIDTKGFDEALIVCNCGDMEASATLAITVLEDTDSAMGSAVAIEDAAMALVDATDDNTVLVGRINLRDEARKRYIRVKGVGATDATDYGCVVILMGANVLPVTQENTIEFSV